ncbi:hypothetical protein B0H17DRAFT_164633 [Mycena rosella]|uniref:Uncharacterized protein n=1 Tax=Mycena rosella TaxID=1033263 RepID=A0AAD7DX02_MYCRO|nr:hypothetical protein B0H17DRAFT_164633 [Mycena rosella]
MNMFRIASSVLSLVSFSSMGLVGLFGGSCIGAQITASILLSGLSVAKTSLHTTRPLEIGPLPTECVPSNDKISIPYVAIIIMAYAALVSASLFCSRQPASIASIRARFQQQHRQSPASESMDVVVDSPCNRRPPRGLHLFHRPALPNILTFGRTRIPLESPIFVLERFFPAGLHAAGRAAMSCISTAKIYISLHGWQHSKTVLFAIGCYPSLILVKRGVRSLIGIRSPTLMELIIPAGIYNEAKAYLFVPGVFAGSAVIVAFSPQLDRIICFFVIPSAPISPPCQLCS